VVELDMSQLMGGNAPAGGEQENMKLDQGIADGLKQILASQDINEVHAIAQGLLKLEEQDMAQEGVEEKSELAPSNK